MLLTTIILLPVAMLLCMQQSCNRSNASNIQPFTSKVLAALLCYLFIENYVAFKPRYFSVTVGSSFHSHDIIIKIIQDLKDKKKNNPNTAIKIILR